MAEQLIRIDSQGTPSQHQPNLTDAKTYVTAIVEAISDDKDKIANFSEWKEGNAEMAGEFSTLQRIVASDGMQKSKQN